MSGVGEILISVIAFAAIIMALSLVIMAARSVLIPDGDVEVVVNGERTINTAVGGKLLGTLSGANLHLPSACGGKGTCGQCRVTVASGGGSALPTERAVLTRSEIDADVRLACQVAVREDMTVQVPQDVFGVRKWNCRVRSNHNVATYIKELVLEYDTEIEADFSAGGYVQIHCPPYEGKFSAFDIDEQFHDEWDRFQLWRYESGTAAPTTRGYSLANYPAEEGGMLKLNVRIATPPPGAKPSVPAGIVSSYIFGLKPGDQVEVSGPYGEFFIRDNDKEMIYIGGGAGMAPMRSHLLELFLQRNTDRKVSYWYGARSLREVFYQDTFDELAAGHDNFQWNVALSEPQPEDNWTGYTGFIHDVVYRHHLADHPAPEDCEYYMCGPPLMIAAVMKMLEDLGVERESILFDDFGG